MNDFKVKEAADQTEKLKAIDYDFSRVQLRIEDTQKLIDARSYDLRNKQIIIDDVQAEIVRVKDLNGRNGTESSILRRDIDKQLAEVYDLRKEIEYQGQRNADLSA